MVLTTKRVRAGALAMAGAALLSACGTRYTTPAAVVDGHRISQGTLKRQVDLALTNPSTAAQARTQAGRKDLNRRVLVSLIQLQLVENYAAANAISVTPGEVDQEVRQIVQQVGGQAQFDQQLASQHLALSQARAILGRDVLFSKVIEALAARRLATSSADQQEKAQVFDQWMTQRMEQASIDVNPQFGRLDVKKRVIVPITSTAE